MVRAEKVGGARQSVTAHLPQQLGLGWQEAKGKQEDEDTFHYNVQCLFPQMVSMGFDGNRVIV